MMPFCTKNLGNADVNINFDFIAVLNVRIVFQLHVTYRAALRHIQGGRCDDLKSRTGVVWCDTTLPSLLKVVVPNRTASVV